MSTTPSVSRRTCTPDRPLRRSAAEPAGALGAGGSGGRGGAVGGAATAGAAAGGDGAVPATRHPSTLRAAIGTVTDAAGAPASARVSVATMRHLDRHARRRDLDPRLASRLRRAHALDELLTRELAPVDRRGALEQLGGLGHVEIEPAHAAARRRQAAEAGRAARGVDELGRIGGPAARRRPADGTRAVGHAHTLPRGIGVSADHPQRPFGGHSCGRGRARAPPAVARVGRPQRAPCPCSRLSGVHPRCRMLRRARAGESTS